jgi:F420-0:gamma-glutamyl ligase-like protein
MDPYTTEVALSDGSQYTRKMIKTHLITSNDDIVKVVNSHVAGQIGADDIVFVSERIVAISQGRSFPISTIKPSKMAVFLSNHVQKTPAGIGLGSPWTMELALREVNVLRILFAAAVAAVTRPFGVRGLFYKIAGNNVNAIDGPTDNTIPPYNKHAKLGPKNPGKVAEELARTLGCRVAIVDSNDIGMNVLGRSDKSLSDEFCTEVFKGNPFGQNDEQTPIAIIKKTAN